MKKCVQARHFRTTAKLVLSHYETLGISRDATPTEVKAAYYKRSMELHPDKVTGNREQFEKVTNAYKVLSDERLRRIHDQTEAVRKQYAGLVHQYGSGSKTQFSSEPLAFDFDAWTKKHYFNQAFRQRKEEVENRKVLRKMKKDVAERENVVFGVSALFLILLAYTLHSVRDETSSFDKSPHLTEAPWVRKKKYHPSDD